MENIKKTVKKIKKELGKEITIDNLSQALSKRGFSLLYTDSPEGIEQLEYYKLPDYAKTKKCFTYCSSVKLVFVDGTLHKSDITKLLLHELAHIELRHIGYTDYHKYDEVSSEIEADAVAYNVLSGNSKKYTSALFIVISVLLVNALGIAFSKEEQRNVPINAEPTQIVEENQNYTIDDIADAVYVTRTGKKFHRKSCRYVKTDGAKPLSRDEAIKKYTPCKVCTP